MLQFIEQPLQSQRNALDRVIVVGGHEVDGTTKLVGAVERLEQGVHVARGPLVLQTHIASVLAGVPTESDGKQAKDKAIIEE